MSKKFFSLINGETLHLAPKTKIIPAESLASLLNAEEVLKTVDSQAEQYKMKVAAECEKLKEKARQEGFEQGYSEWIEKIAALEEEIKKVRKDSEAVVLPIALAAAKKIVGRELDLSKSTVLDIITNSLKAVATHKKIKIYVNKKELDLMEKHREKIKKIFENLEALSIVPQDTIEPGGCIIETEGGIINAQLENQWIILEQAFQRLIKPAKTQSAAPKPEPSLKPAPPPLPSSPPPAQKSRPVAKKPVIEEVEEEEEEEDEEEWEEEEEWNDEETEE